MPSALHETLRAVDDELTSLNLCRGTTRMAQLPRIAAPAPCENLRFPLHIIPLLTPVWIHTSMCSSLAPQRPDRSTYRWGGYHWQRPPARHEACAGGAPPRGRFVFHTAARARIHPSLCRALPIAHSARARLSYCKPPRPVASHEK